MLLLLLLSVVLGSCPLGFDKITRGDNKTFCETHTFLRDADPGTTTDMGCQCQSTCGTSADQITCDWCYTKNNCGKYSMTRFAYWDYCIYPKQDEDSAWNSKEDAIWQKVVSNSQAGSYPTITGLLTESVITTFDDQWDYMPEGRMKYIHSVGAVCKVNMMVAVDKFTGILKQGVSSGLIRMGSALPMGSMEIFPMSTVPGNGYKFLRSGRQSANWVSLYTLDGQPEWNFFTHNQSNHIPPPGLKQQALVPKFGDASNCITMVGLSDAARYDQNGNESPNPVFPYQLIFQPSPDAAQYLSNSKQTQAQFLSAMGTIPGGVKLWTVYSIDQPRGQPEYMADIITRSGCTSSSYGDGKLFFRHQRIEEDLAIRPDWVELMDAEAECGKRTVNPTPPQNCDHRNSMVLNRGGKKN